MVARKWKTNGEKKENRWVLWWFLPIQIIHIYICLCIIIYYYYTASPSVCINNVVYTAAESRNRKFAQDVSSQITKTPFILELSSRYVYTRTRAPTVVIRILYCILYYVFVYKCVYLYRRVYQYFKYVFFRTTTHARLLNTYISSISGCTDTPSYC